METYRLVRVPLGIPALPDALRGMKILLLGDLHDMYFGDGNEDLVKDIRREDPDYIFVSGDMMDRVHRAGQSFIDLVVQLGGRYPIYACLGNHELDVKKAKESVYRAFMAETAALGVHWLLDDHVELSCKGESFHLFGLSTRKSGFPATEKSIRARLGDCPAGVNLVLAHDPTWFPALARWGASAVSSGHIHGGLVRLPMLGGVIAPQYRLFPTYDRGLFTYGDARLYVTAGFGDSIIHIRVNNPRELTLLTLEDAPPEKRPWYATKTPVQTGETIAGRRLFASLFWRLIVLIIMVPVFILGVKALGTTRDIGSVCMTGVAGVSSLLAVIPVYYKKFLRGRARIVYIIVKALIIAGAAYFCVISALMINACLIPPKPDATLIILGCKVDGTSPSLMLQNRLNAGLAYLAANPDAPCVVSGGQGSDEGISEAACMDNYLLAHGISPDRIYMEDKSVSTQQNLQFSADIIRENGLSTNVAIATDEFHHLRANMFAAMFGLSPGSVVSHTPWWLLGGYWVREMFGVPRVALLGY